MRPGQVVGPMILIGLGVVFLVNNLALDIPFRDLIRTWWPLILIALGIAQFVGALAGRGSLPGGVIMITLGGLFLMQRLWDISFRDTWPVLLIAIGGIGLLRALLGPALFEHRYMRGGVRR